MIPLVSIENCQIVLARARAISVIFTQLLLVQIPGVPKKVRRLLKNSKKTNRRLR